MRRPADGAIGGRFPAPRPPEGLAGPAGRLPVLGRTLSEWQERALLLAGARLPGGDAAPDPSAPRLLVREDALVSAPMLAAFAEAARARGGDAALRVGGRMGALAAELALGGPDRPLAAWLEDGAGDAEERALAAPPLEVDPRERLLHVPVAGPGGGEDVAEVPVGDRLALPAGHWLQCLWANLLSLPAVLWRELVGRHPLAAAWRLGWAALRARSVHPAAVGARLGRRGRGCRVHPSAVVEGCWLGDDVVIGAGAVVRASVLGDGAVVEDLALVEASVLSAGARVQRQAMVKYAVLGPGAAVAGTVQLGVVDRRAAVRRGAVLMDQNLDGSPVRVLAGGALHPAPLGLAGGCVGEGTVLGAGVLVAPGRAVPPGLRVAAAPEAVLRRLPAEPPAGGLAVVRGGTLEAP